jgi:cold shock CspA family protein
MSGKRRGTVVAYDAPAGLGTVSSGGDEFLLHCTEIPDGSREIAVGTVVEFDTVVRFGVSEATGVVVVGAPETLR